MNGRRILMTTFALSVSICGAAKAEPVAATFSYQGELRDHDTGVLIDGECTLEFSLWDNDTVGEGVLRAGPITESITISNGKFTCPLTLEGEDLDEGGLFLEIAVCCPPQGESCCMGAAGGCEPFETVEPRQAVMPTFMSNYTQNLAPNEQDLFDFFFRGVGWGFGEGMPDAYPKVTLDFTREYPFMDFGGLVDDPHGPVVSMGDFDPDGTLNDRWSFSRSTSLGGSGLHFKFGANADPSLDTTRAFMNPAGDFGLGTTNPTERFDVRGSARVDDDLYARGGNLAFGASGNDYGGVGFGYRFSDANGLHTHIGSDFASRLEFESGGFRFYSAPAASPGAPVSWSTRMRIREDGRVGIGTSTPSDTLHVNGIVRSDVGFRLPDGTIVDDAADLGSNLWNLNGGDLYYDAGNVGIGTTAPATTLHVLGEDPGDVVGGQLRVHGTDSSGNAGTGGGVQFTGHDGNIARNWGAVQALKENDIVGNTRSFMRFSTRATGNLVERMRIDSSGKVGIGTTDPLSRLQVASGNNWRWDIGDGWGDFNVGDGTHGLSIGVATDGGGAGIVRMWPGPDRRLIFGDATNGDTMAISEKRVGIGTNMPETPLHITGGDDVTPGGGGEIVLGTTTGPNLALDSNEIMARNNGAASTLNLNLEGGSVSIGNAGSNITLRGTVNRPNDPIDASVLPDEPGVASAVNGGTVSMTEGAGITTLISQSIDVPTTGYVLAIASSGLRADPACPSASGLFNAEFGVSDTAANFPANQEVNFEFQGCGNDFSTPIAVHGLFSVTAGTRTFYYLGRANVAEGALSVADLQLTLVFLPTAYGTVQGTFVATEDGDDWMDGETAAYDVAHENTLETESTEDRPSVERTEEQAESDARFADLERRVDELEALLREETQQ